MKTDPDQIPVYLDYNATTPPDPMVIEVMTEVMKTHFGNPSSTHYYGTQSRKIIVKARQQLAELIHCKPSEIIFTSGGTESNNMAIRGVAELFKSKGRHIITSTIEHPAVSEVCNRLEKEGFEISRVGVNGEGIVNPDEVYRAIRSDTILISIMHANNETGAIQPITPIAEMAESHGIVFHTDAAQTVGKIPVDVQSLGINLLSIAGHKFYGPKGIGALYIREGTRIKKMLEGADHEQNLRPGTENTIQIAGIGAASVIALKLLSEGKYLEKKYRDLLWNRLCARIADVKSNTPFDKALPNTLSLLIPGADANTLLAELNGVAASPGAACHANDIFISPTLKSMGLSNADALSTIRFSTGRFTTENEIQIAADQIATAVEKLRGKRDHIQPIPKNEKVRLTRFTHGLGCACKISPGLLNRIFKNLDSYNDKNILAGHLNSEDAAVYKLDEKTAVIQTIDFFTPVVDDPVRFGEIAAANALSDIYAMGGNPVFALNIVGFPHQRLDAEILEEIIRGAQNVAREAGISILGGHSIENTEPIFGMAVTGFADPGKILYNSAARENDVLILTKPLGTGILSTAMKRDLLTSGQEESLYKCMRELNRIPKDLMMSYPVNSCTDITGFGLIGHLYEMCRASGLSAEINLPGIKFLEGSMELASQRIISGGTLNNRQYYEEYVHWEETIPEYRKDLLCDGQTSGGLLISLPAEPANYLLDELLRSKINAFYVGKIMKTKEINIYVN